MPGQSDPGNRQADPFHHGHVDRTQTDRAARAAIDDPVQVAVLGLVIVLLVAVETEFVEEEFVDRRHQRVGVAPYRQHGGQLFGEPVELGGVGGFVEIGILRPGQEPDALLHVQLLAGLEGESEEGVVRLHPVEVRDDGPRAAAEMGVVAQEVRFQPVAGDGAAGLETIGSGARDGVVLVPQQDDERAPLAFSQHHRLCWTRLAHSNGESLRPPGTIKAELAGTVFAVRTQNPFARIRAATTVFPSVSPRP